VSEVGGDLLAYYALRAAEYEQVYENEDPQYQSELLEIGHELESAMQNRDVLEVACGTGWWTRVAARTASSIVATDVTVPVLEIAKQKQLDPRVVQFRTGDAYDVASITGSYNAAFANFWLSHIPRRRIQEFVAQLSCGVVPGSTLFFADNNYVPGLGGDLVDGADDDTYKRRLLNDGSEHLVLKNYYAEGDLRALLRDQEDVVVKSGKFFWWVSCTTK